METFIQANSVWLVPLVNVLLTIVIKVSAKSDKKPLKKFDLLDFGFDMTITSMILILTNTKNSVGVVLFVIIFTAVVVVTNIVRRIGVGSDNTPNWIGLIIADLLGIISLRVATLFIGGYFS